MTVRSPVLWPSMLAAVLTLGLPATAWCQFQGAGTLNGANYTTDQPLGPKNADELVRDQKARDGKPATAAPALSNSDRVKLGVQAAQELLKAQKYPQALAKLREVDALPGKTASDTYLLERTRVAAASQTSDNALLIQSLEAVLATGQTPPDDELKFADLLSRHYFNQKDYAKAITWITRYFRAGGNDADMRRSLLYAHYLSNDYARVVQEVNGDIQADEKANRTPAEYQLKLLASSAQKLNDQATYNMAVAKHTSYYPRK